MKKFVVIACVAIAFLISGFSVYSYVNEKNRYAGQTVVPEQRDDLPLYEGLKFKEHAYVMKGNHWYSIYEFYKKELPENGWKLVNKMASLEGNGGFMMDWEKNEKNMSIHGGWNSFENQTEIIFDLNPAIK